MGLSTKTVIRVVDNNSFTFTCEPCPWNPNAKCVSVDNELESLKKLLYIWTKQLVEYQLL